jgi:protein-L-isoaspartate(D-aspartate) O-methyltransferase
MVREQIEARGIADPVVLSALRRVPREWFVPAAERALAYQDHPLAIGDGQTISQPYVVALCAALVRPAPGVRALDIGTGSGYQAAILAATGAAVIGVERLPQLAARARAALSRLTSPEFGISAVPVHVADGARGWDAAAPYDAIVVAAAAERIPSALVDQLATLGRLVLPIGTTAQELVLVERRADGTTRETAVGPVRFVPLIHAPPPDDPPIGPVG